MENKLEEAIRNDIGKRGDKAVVEILRVLEDESYQISEHALVNWQDKPLHRFWARIGWQIDKIAANIEEFFGLKGTSEHIS